MEEKLRILIEKRNRDMVSEFEGTYLEVISALIYNACFTLSQSQNHQLPIGEGKKILNNIIDKAFVMLKEEGKI